MPFACACARPAASATVGKDQHDLGGIGGVLGGGDQGGEIAAAAGDEDRRPLASRSRQGRAARRRPSAPRRAARGGRAPRHARRRAPGRAALRRQRRHPRRRTMPIPQLKVRIISESATGPDEPAEDRRHGDRRKVDLRRQMAGQHPRHVLQQPAAGDVGERLDCARSSGSPRGTSGHRCASARAAPRRGFSPGRRAPGRTSEARPSRRRGGPAKSRSNEGRSKRGRA